jgi:Leucine-rich repeat (LRR) protein
MNWSFILIVIVALSLIGIVLWISLKKGLTTEQKTLLVTSVINVTDISSPYSTNTLGITGGNFTVDWGDGTILSIVNKEENKEIKVDHKYNNLGSYTIKLFGENLLYYSINSAGEGAGGGGAGLSYDNKIKEINLINCKNLKALLFGRNQVTLLDVSKNSNLETLYCNGNQLISLDISNNINLEILDCSNNQLISLDVSNNNNLETLQCYSNQLISLDVSKNVNLKKFECANNQLISLDLTNNSNLETLYCSNIGLTDLSDLIGLNKNSIIYFDISSNNISSNSLNLDIFINLKEIDVGSTNISSIIPPFPNNIDFLIINDNIFTGSFDLVSYTKLKNFTSDGNNSLTNIINIPPNIQYFNCLDCSINSVGDINIILDTINTNASANNIKDGSIDLSGGTNAAPTTGPPNGIAAINNLVNNLNWRVVYN